MIPLIDLKEQAGVAMNVRGQLSDPAGDFKVTLGALAFADELGRLLWRIKYGEQLSGLHRAALLLGDTIRKSGKFSRSQPSRVKRSVKANRLHPKEVQEARDVIDAVACRALHEWLHPECMECKGRGILSGAVRELGASAVTCKSCGGSGENVIELFGPFLGRAVVPYAIRTVPKIAIARCDPCHGRGVLVPKRKSKATHVCKRCGGGGREPVNDAARARALGISLDQYHRGWPLYFDALRQLLEQIDAQVEDVMRQRLRK
jgi:transcription elongation factor Elf1